MTLVYWGRHFKFQYNYDKIDMNTPKMADNHLCILHFHHINWNRSRFFPYFDFDNMKFVAEKIRGLSKYSMKKIEAKMSNVKVSIMKSL